MNRYTNLHRIQQLDPRRDCHEIYRTMILVDFGGWDTLMGLQLAFYSTYGVPAIAALLDQAGELLARPRKRALDTALLMLELVDHGFAHPQGQKVVQRLRRIHGRYQIANADYLYVLSALMVVPTRWLQRYGWRKVCCHEQAATYWFYRELGQQLGIQHIPQATKRSSSGSSPSRVSTCGSPRQVGASCRPAGCCWSAGFLVHWPRWRGPWPMSSFMTGCGGLSGSARRRDRSGLPCTSRSGCGRGSWAWGCCQHDANRSRRRAASTASPTTRSIPRATRWPTWGRPILLVSQESPPIGDGRQAGRLHLARSPATAEAGGWWR